MITTTITGHLSKRQLSAVLLVGLFLTAGCSTGTSTLDAEEVGPLTAMQDAIIDTFGEDYITAKQIESENSIASCMVTEGFEYIPEDLSTTGRIDLDDPTRQDTQEWVAKNGYGIALVFGQPSTASIDPNSTYLATLSSAEAEAYHDALYGAADDDHSEDEATSHLESLESAGCWGAAELAVHRDRDALQDPQFDDIKEAMQAFYLSTSQDPRIVELSARWADCMADAGYTDLATPEAAVMSIVEAQAEVPLEQTTASEELLPSSKDLAAFRELEISTALADFACQEKVDWATVSAEVVLELEKVFVADNKVALDEYMASVENARQPIG